MLSDLIREKLKQLPEKIGVYMFLDDSGNVIYIGKASNIKKRVLSHFKNTENPKDLALSEKTRDIKFIITSSETEALILEDTLIKKHKPVYNARLKDDKTYPYIKITVNELFPRLAITREVKADDSLYFGPYSNVGLLRKMIRYLRRIFPIRTCKIKISIDKPQKTCLDYHLKLCIAPCTGTVSPSAYRELVNNFIEILNGRYDQLINQLRDKMFSLAREMKFEEAAKIRDIIKALEKIREKQRVVLPDNINEDLIGIANTEDSAAIFLIKIRNGRLIGTEQFLMDTGSELEKSNLISAFIEQYYFVTEPPTRIVLPETHNSIKNLETILSNIHNKPINIDDASNNAELALIEMAIENANIYLSSEISLKKRKMKLLNEVKELFNLKQIPIRIECFDISTLGGKFSVGSMVVFENASPKKREYRRFKIRIEGKPDDYRMIKEIILRRFKRWPNKKPDLILIDGGKMQIKAVQDALKTLNITDIPVLGIAKKFELIYTPTSIKPIKLRKDSNILQLFQRIRDEAHRFAITYHRKIRTKNMLISLLDTIPGIGPKRKRAILSRYKTIEELKNASIKDLIKIPGITSEIAKRIKEKLKIEKI